jgi:iron complex outermembrane recepter protein
MTNRFAAVALLTLAIAAGRPALAQDGRSQLAGPSEEDLFREIPPVLSDTRTLRAPLDVPGEFTVITAEDIRSSGATTLVELLETVPSLEVMRVSRSDANVSARGFNPLVSTRMLVMIDGRSVYLDFTGVVLWESLNVALQEIDRIEVIVGPGSVLYGANALSGVVNIITKRPHELAEQRPQGLHAGWGRESTYGSAWLARAGELDSVKVSGTYRGYDNFRNDTLLYQQVPHGRDTTGHRVKQIQSTYEHLFDDGTLMSLAGGLSSLDGAITTQIGPLNIEMNIFSAKLNLEKGLWKLQSFVNSTHGDLVSAGNPLPPPLAPALPLVAREEDIAWDTELQRTHILGDHTFLWGLNYRRVTTQSDEFIGGREREAIYGMFVQDELELGRFLLLGGLRLDDHPKAGFQVSPRLSLVYRVSSDARLRLLWSRSFRNPSNLATYGALTLESSNPLQPDVQLIGNDRLEPINADSYELGYRAQLGERTKLDATAYLNTFDNLQGYGATAPATPFVIQVNNIDRGKAWGSKLALELALGAATKGTASYHFQSASGPLQSITAPHKLLLGLRGPLLGAVHYSLDGRYVSHTEYRGDPVERILVPERDVPSHFGVDAFLGWDVARDVEVGFRVRNLFHQVRSQFPVGDEIGTEWLFTVRWEP